MKAQSPSIAPIHRCLGSKGSSRMTDGTHGPWRRVRAASSVVPAALRALLVSAMLAAASAHAVIYDFLQVTTNATSGKFTSINGNGFITAIATGGAFLTNNNTVWSSQFPNLFLASGTVDGWLTRADDFAVYTNTFYLTNYTLSSNTVFGMWNITEETNTYSLQLFAGNTQIAPVFNWNFLGYDDDALHNNIGWYHMNLDPIMGKFNPTNFLLSGTDCDAAFWDHIPTNTTRIVLIGRLNSTNHDGVVFYFAEPRPCVLTCPSNITVTVCGPGTNVYYPAPTFSGNCGTNLTVLTDFPSGSFFPLGTNVVILTLPGQNAFCSFTVTVLNSDTNPPVITCPTNILLFTCGSNAVATYTATATDDQGVPVIIYSTPSGSTFPLGTNAVACTAIDACSNTATCSFNVIVKQIPPVWGVVCPSESLSVNVTGCPPVMPNISYLVTVTNVCPIPGGLTTTQVPSPGTVLTPGIHPVTVTVCATNGACQSCSWYVNASLSPGCCTPQTFLSLFSGRATNGVLLAGGALDPQFSTGGPQFTTLHPYVPAVIHPLWLANGPSSQWIGPVPGFTDSPVGVYAFTNRFFLCNTNQAALNGQWTLDDGGAIWLNGVPTGVDITSAAPNLSWHPLSITSGFVPGWNTLVFFVTNVVPSVTGLRTEITGTGCCIPNCVSITCQTNITVGTCGGPVQVNYPTPPASSGCGTIVSVVCEPPSGSFFPLGTNTVQCTAIDSAGNAVTCSFTVTVVLAITPLCAPVLTINLSGTSVVISWPDTTVGFSLEFNDSLSSPLGWTPLNGPGDPPVTDTNGTYQIILPLNHDSRYYRLRY